MAYLIDLAFSWNVGESDKWQSKDWRKARGRYKYLHKLILGRYQSSIETKTFELCCSLVNHSVILHVTNDWLIIVFQNSAK